MSRKLKVGLIGLGGIMGYAHMPRYRGAQDVEIVAICDILPEKIEAFHRNFGMREVPSFTDYKELLEVEGLDYVGFCCFGIGFMRACRSDFRCVVDRFAQVFALFWGIRASVCQS